MRTGDNIRLRSDGRYEARYVKMNNDTGETSIVSVYGKTYEEAAEKRDRAQGIFKRKTSEMNLLILGAGDHGKDVYDMAKSLRIFKKIDFLDDDSSVPGAIGPWSKAQELISDYSIAIPAVGRKLIREEWIEKLESWGYLIPTIIHQTAVVPDNAEIGAGTVVCARATIGTNVKIGRGCIICSGAVIDRDVVIPDYSFVRTGEIVRGTKE